MKLASVLACGLLLSAVAANATAQTQSDTPTFSPDHATLNIYDGFETPTLGNLWGRSRFVPGSVVMENKVVRAGKQAAAVTVRAGNMFDTGRGGDADNERSELLEARPLVARQGEAFEYSFSMFFPQDFPIVPTRLVIAQWKQYCPEGVEVCSNDSPVLALRYIDGVLIVSQDLNGKFIKLYEKKAEYRNRWLDFRIQARFTPDNGRVKVWLNGDSLVDYRGATADTENATTGYPAAGHFYFKMGLYRNAMKEPMTVYIDEYRKRALGHDGF